MRSRQHSGSQHGVTLIEACVVMAIAAITLSTAAPSFASFMERRRIDGESAQLIADIHLVRSEAARRQVRLRLTLQNDDDGTCWLLHTGNATDCRCLANGGAACVSGAMAVKSHRIARGDKVAVSGNVSSMVFDPLHGTSTPAGTLKITGASGRMVHHVVNVMGRVRSCSPSAPAGALAGYRVC